MSTPLTDKINALTAYANEITGESDTTLSEAVHTLADGYGQGGGDSIWASIVDHTVTEINDTDGLCKAVGYYVFYYCDSLTSVIFPSATRVESYAFYGCRNLSSVYFPSVTRIDSHAFDGCSGLSFIDFPSATNLGSYCFTDCTALTALILRRQNSTCYLSNANAFNSTPIKSGTGYIYVPSSLIETYKTATNWKTLAAQFRALEDYTVDGTITGDLDPNKI